jgi:Type II secretion system (T2SS), protein M subtype b
MMPLKRILMEKRFLALPLLLGLLANIFVYILVVYPLGVKSAGARERADAAAVALKAAEQESTAARELVAGKARAEEELVTFYDKVVPANLAAARRITYARLPELARRSSVRYEAGTFNTERDTKGNRLNRLHMHLVLRGDYENLRRFIYDVETSQEFVIIDDVTLVQPDAAMPLTLTLELSTYYRIQANGT